MGKSLRGKECDEGICQRKDSLYSARFVTKTGKRQVKCFSSLPEARNWLDDAKYADKHENIFVPPDMTVDAWFEFWIVHIVGDLAPNTRRNYRERYEYNVKPLIGGMQLADVKPMHCKMVLNQMEEKYAGSTIRQTYIAMGTMLRSAVMNDMIQKHPMDGVRFTKPTRAVNDIKFLTVEEQQKFLAVAKKSHNYYQYALILETGLRTGELIGLTWDSVDWKKRTLTVNKTLEYRHEQGEWRAGPPKTQQSYRTIPLTNRAYEILEKVHARVPERKETDILSLTLDYLDRHTGEKASLSCVILFLSTGEQKSQRRTVPMIPTYISSAMKQGSNTFVCTPCDIPMLQEQSKAVCSRRCCKNCWVMPASKQQWIGMFM